MLKKHLGKKKDLFQCFPVPTPDCNFLRLLNSSNNNNNFAFFQTIFSSGKKRLSQAAVTSVQQY